jgi:Mg2+-importing ATPase
MFSHGPAPSAFWRIPAGALLRQLEATEPGLTTEHARQRLVRFGASRLEPGKRTDRLALFLRQFKSPIVLILLFAAALSYVLDDPADALIIRAIILASAALGFWQEYGATHAVEPLLAVVQIKATAWRDGSPQEVPVEGIVPGGVILVRAGDVIPGDCRLLKARDLFVDEAALTGETFPVEKAVGILTAAPPLGQRSNVVFLGTHVVSGTGKAVAVRTGKDAEFGQVSQCLRLKPPETEFERGVGRFGYFLTEVTLLLVMAISPSTSTWTGQCSTRCCSPWRWRWGRPPNSCPPSSASTWPLPQTHGKFSARTHRVACFHRRSGPGPELQSDP